MQEPIYDKIRNAVHVPYKYSGFKNACAYYKLWYYMHLFESPMYEGKDKLNTMRGIERAARHGKLNLNDLLDHYERREMTLWRTDWG